jgi:uncharacterized protein
MLIWGVGHFLAICIGISLGLLGGGGGVLALPMLVYVMGIPPKSAIAMTLVIVGMGSLLGLIPHWRKGYVNLRIALIFGSATAVGSFLGARAATLPFVTGKFQMLLFALMLLLAAGLMIRRSSEPRLSQVVSEPEISVSNQTLIALGSRTTQTFSQISSPDLETPQQESDTQLTPLQSSWVWLIAEGLVVGLLTGLVGIGGGFAIVPALVLLGKLPIRQAIGTSLLIIIFNAISGLLGYLGKVSIDWSMTLSLTIVASLGTLMGSYLAQFIPAKQLQRSFGYFMLLVAMYTLTRIFQGL